jgi:FKBP-type peptidyl-prolyl cis-trans isomerase FkpA
MNLEPSHPSRRALLLGLLTSVTAAACGGGGNSETAPTPVDTSYVTNLPLTTTDLSVGTGAEAATGSRIVVDYYGWLYSATGTDNKGTLFDTSLQTGRTPFQLVLGAGNVIQGWEQGIPGMKVGGIRRLIIPPALAYGSTGSSDGRIPPNATLVFEVRLNDILVSAT